MALLALSEDEQRILFTQLCNVLDPRGAVDFSSASQWLREPTQALLQQLRADYEAATALCLKMGMRSCKELREAMFFHWINKGLKMGMLSCKELREAKEVYCHCTHLSHRGRPCVSRQAGFGAAGAQGPAPPPLLRRRWSRRRAAAG